MFADAIDSRNHLPPERRHGFFRSKLSEIGFGPRPYLVYLVEKPGRRSSLSKHPSHFAIKVEDEWYRLPNDVGSPTLDQTPFQGRYYQDIVGVTRDGSGARRSFGTSFQ